MNAFDNLRPISSAQVQARAGEVIRSDVLKYLPESLPGHVLRYGHRIAGAAAIALTTRTSWSGSWYGSGLSSMALITLKMAVFAPIPRASAVIATIENPGFFNRKRIDWRTSCAKWLMSKEYALMTQKVCRFYPGFALPRFGAPAKPPHPYAECRRYACASLSARHQRLLKQNGDLRAIRENVQQSIQ